MTTRLGRSLGRRGQGGVGDARGMRGRHGVPGRGGRRRRAAAHAGEGWPGIHARPGTGAAAHAGERAGDGGGGRGSRARRRSEFCEVWERRGFMGECSVSAG